MLLCTAVVEGALACAGGRRKRQLRGTLRRRHLYTPGYRLKAGEFRPLAAPLVVWPLKVMLLPYNQLQNFCITVEQWKISDVSFNSLYASARLTLKEIIDLEPEFQLLLKRKLPGSKRSYEVHKMRVRPNVNSQLINRTKYTRPMALYDLERFKVFRISAAVSRTSAHKRVWCVCFGRFHST